MTLTNIVKIMVTMIATVSVTVIVTLVTVHSDIKFNTGLQ